MATHGFAEWFLRQLKRRVWGQADFFRESGVPKATVNSWCLGTRLPNPRRCKVIADVFGLDLDEVLMRAGHRPPLEPLLADDPRLEIIAMTKRVQLTPDREITLRSLLRTYLEHDPRERAGSN